MGCKSSGQFPKIKPAAASDGSLKPADLGAYGDYLPLPIGTLGSTGRLDCQTYLKIGPHRYVKFCTPGLEINIEIKEKLRENRHAYIYVKTADSAALNKYLATTLSDALENP
ncbi:MAG: hypothetical protein V2A61_06225, partial [Calditrichota bacterium]